MSLVPTAFPTVFTTLFPTDSVASNTNVLGLSLQNHIILSVILVVFAGLVIMGIFIYCCIVRKRNINRQKSMDQNDKSIVQDSPLNVRTTGGDVEMDDVEAAHDKDIIPEYGSISEKKSISL
jgi:hypothetical protein